MSMCIDPRTGFELGDPSVIPLSRGVPSEQAIVQALSRMILSASGWRTVFAASGDEEDARPDVSDTHLALAALIADTFAEYAAARCGKNARIVVGIDARPTGTLIADTMIRVLLGRGLSVEYVFITAAPEIMAYSRQAQGFVYISASHNPVGHNGVKFGLDDGGVIPGGEAACLIAEFKKRCAREDSGQYAAALIAAASAEAVSAVYADVPAAKERALAAYRAFTREVISGSTDAKTQDELFDRLGAMLKQKPLTVVCDMNGSARTVSIDESFMTACGLGFYAINGTPRGIAHTIIPEAENLVYCAEAMTSLKTGKIPCAAGAYAALGYMPDCDGDRGNIVFWNEKTQEAQALKAQEGFALAVIAELAYSSYLHGCDGTKESLADCRFAVAVNDPTSLRINKIAAAFGAAVVRAEVGEANVVNRARELRAQGYEVRILGEGSNGGNITHPAAVRDPLNTVFALIKLLALRDEMQPDGSVRPGLFHIWCMLSGQERAYRDDFTLADVIAAIPVYTTTGTSEARALLHIRTADHGVLKGRFQTLFEEQWEQKKDELARKYGIVSYEACLYNGTREQRSAPDFSASGRGGLKILFKDSLGCDIASMWMRGSGTEPVFRIMCDICGNNAEGEAYLLEWETQMLKAADSAAV